MLLPIVYSVPSAQNALAHICKARSYVTLYLAVSLVSSYQIQVVPHTPSTDDQKCLQTLSNVL